MSKIVTFEIKVELVNENTTIDELIIIKKDIVARIKVNTTVCPKVMEGCKMTLQITNNR